MDSTETRLSCKLETQFHPKRSGTPLEVFDSGEDTQPEGDVHACVKAAMGIHYYDLTSQINADAAKVVSQNPHLFKGENKITFNECGAIIYYTYEYSSVTKRELSVYYKLNKSLHERSVSNNIEVWKPYLCLLLRGLAKLPDFEGVVYRAIDSAIISNPTASISPNSGVSKNFYDIGSTVVWVSFTSTSKTRVPAANFLGSVTGTIMELYVKDGKDISVFSKYSEGEILLLPNVHFLVAKVEKSQSIGPVDFVSLTQEDTPFDLRVLRKVKSFQEWEQQTKQLEEIVRAVTVERDKYFSEVEKGNKDVPCPNIQ